MQVRLILLVFLATAFAPASDLSTSKKIIQSIRELGKGGEKSIPALVPYLTDRDRDVRDEAVKAIIRIDTMRSVDPLLTALHDADLEIQNRAIDGLVNAYAPGYVAHGVGGYFSKGVKQVKLIFTNRDDTVVDPDVKVRADIAAALSDKIANGADMTVRTNAALAAGILRAAAAVPALEGGLRSKNTDLIFECLIALQKINDPAAGPSVALLARDLDERVQETTLETLGQLHSVSSAPDIRSAFKNARDLRIQRAALEALAMLGLAADRPLFQQNLSQPNPGQSDAELRASALEGLARIREPDDFATMKAAFTEPDTDWRVASAAAFGMVMEGDNGAEALSPLSYLVEGFSLKQRAAVSEAYLTEVARNRDTRTALAKVINDEPKDRKIGILNVLSGVNAPDSLQTIQQYTGDRDRDVAFAAMRALRIAQNRSPS